MILTSMFLLCFPLWGFEKKRKENAQSQRQPTGPFPYPDMLVRTLGWYCQEEMRGLGCAAPQDGTCLVHARPCAPFLTLPSQGSRRRKRAFR